MGISNKKKRVQVVIKNELFDKISRESKRTGKSISYISNTLMEKGASVVGREKFNKK